MGRMGLVSGTRLGRYEVERLVGVGGMGEVYSAHDAALGRRVAIKVLTSHRLDAAWDRFQREAKAGALLNHRHICTVFDVGTEGDVRFLVMEYLQGETLACRLRGGALSVSEAAVHGSQLADALAAAHNAGIIHRDVKPGNIMLTPNGVKLLDFGLARITQRAQDALSVHDVHRETEPAHTAAGTVLGTTMYMAPEQLRGEVVDHRVDIYAFGAVLYEMLAGRSPFQAADRTELVAQILHRDPPAVRAVRAGVPTAVAALVQKCLSKAPQDRCARLEDALAVLQAVRSGPAKKSRAASRHASSRRIHSVAVLPFRLIGAPPDSEYFADGMTELLIARIAGITGLRVISRTSVMPYRNTAEPLNAIAARLDVEAIIEGSVLTVGDRLRITVHLIEVAQDATVWAESYDRPISDVLGIQSEIADEVARRVGANLSPTERSALRSWSRVPHEAQDAYLRARYFWNLKNAPSLKKSFEYFFAAMQLAPDYALIHAGLADWYQSAALFRLVDAAEAIAKGRAAAERAIALDPRLGDPHASLGRLRFLAWDWREAEAELLQALRYNANCVMARTWYSAYLSCRSDHDAAIEEMTHAIALDPLNAGLIEGLGSRLYAGRRFAEAVDECSRALELNSLMPSAYYMRALALTHLNRYDEALDDLGRAGVADAGHPSVLVARAYALHRAGRVSEAGNVLEELRRASASAYDLAEGFAACGRIDEALDQLERAAAERAPELVGIYSDPLFDAIRAHDRFKEVAERVGIPAGRSARPERGERPDGGIRGGRQRLPARRRPSSGT